MALEYINGQWVDTANFAPQYSPNLNFNTNTTPLLGNTAGASKAASLKDLFGKVWNPKTGIKALGIGTASNIGAGITEGANLIGNMSDSQKLKKTYDSLRGDIGKIALDVEAMKKLNPIQRNMVRRINRGKDILPSNNVFDSIFNNLGDIGSKTLTGFLTGGAVGAGINGIGSTINAITSGNNQNTAQNIQELQALYNSLYKI